MHSPKISHKFPSSIYIINLSFVILIKKCVYEKIFYRNKRQLYKLQIVFNYTQEKSISMTKLKL